MLWRWVFCSHGDGLLPLLWYKIENTVKICVAYIAVSAGPKTADFCARFVATWLEYPPGVECSLTVICNGGPLPMETALLFSPIENVAFYQRPNDGGWDVSAWIDYSHHTDADMMVCLGESVFFHRAGWLKRLAEAWAMHGPGMYGIFATHNVRAHMNTTAFACDPKFLRGYGRVVQNRADRYEFEHGEKALWRRISRSGKPAMFVTWDGVWPPGSWRVPVNILWRGNQSNLLASCNHVERYFEADENTKRVWEANADSIFR